MNPLYGDTLLELRVASAKDEIAGMAARARDEVAVKLGTIMQNQRLFVGAMVGRLNR